MYFFNKSCSKMKIKEEMEVNSSIKAQVQYTMKIKDKTEVDSSINASINTKIKERIQQSKM
jgi:hypothetical protein